MEKISVADTHSISMLRSPHGGDQSPLPAKPDISVLTELYSGILSNIQLMESGLTLIEAQSKMPTHFQPPDPIPNNKRNPLSDRHITSQVLEKLEYRLSLCHCRLSSLQNILIQYNEFSLEQQQQDESHRNSRSSSQIRKSISTSIQIMKTGLPNSKRRQRHSMSAMQKKFQSQTEVDAAFLTESVQSKLLELLHLYTETYTNLEVVWQVFENSLSTKRTKFNFEESKSGDIISADDDSTQLSLSEPMSNHTNAVASNIDESAPIIREGFMVKRGNIRKNWKRRLFRLYSNGTLCYYNSKNVQLNEIDLSLCKNIGIASADSHKRLWIIRVEMPGRTFEFSCDTEKDRDAWLTHLHKQVNYIQQNTSGAASRQSSTSGRRGSIESIMSILPSFNTPAATPTVNNSDITSLATSQSQPSDAGSRRTSVPQALTITLSKLEYRQLQTEDTLHELEEELEDIATLIFSPPDQLKVIPLRVTWARKPTLTPCENSDSEYSLLTHRIRQFFTRGVGNVIIQGWFLKKLSIQGWKKRWCVLERKVADSATANLVWYVSKDDDRMRGILDLSKLIGARAVASDYNLKHSIGVDYPSFIMEVETMKRKIQLGCNDKVLLQEWIDLIQKHGKYCRRSRAVSDYEDPYAEESDNLQYHLNWLENQEKIDPVII